MIPLWSVPSSSSRSERIIPSETSPRSFALDRQPHRDRRAGQRDGDGRARAEVPRAADDRARLALPHVDRAELEPVGVRVLAGLEDAADAEQAEVAVLVGDAEARRSGRPRSSRRRAGRELLRAAGRTRRTRAARRRGPSSELPQEAEVVLPEQPDVRQAVPERARSARARARTRSRSTSSGS